MKKVYLLLIVLGLAVSSFSQKNVVYLTKADGGAVEGAWPADNDVIIQMFNSDANINLTVKVLDADGVDPATSAAVDLSGYDAIILHDAFGSGDNFWKTGYPGYLGSLPAPAVFNKLYALRSGKALTSGSGASTDFTGVYNLTVTQSGSDLFKGIDVSSGVITVSNGGVDDHGGLTAEKCLQYNTGNVVSAENTLLAYPEGVTDEVAISFSDIPAGTTIDDATTSQRMITLGFNVGMPRNTDYANKSAYTNEGLTIWRNAVYSLAGLTIPEELVDMTFLTSAKEITAAKLHVYGVQGGIKLPANSNANVYSISGKLLQKSVNDDFVSLAKGMYIVRSGNLSAKVMVIE